MITRVSPGIVAQAAAVDGTGDAGEANGRQTSDTSPQDGAWSQWIRTFMLWPEKVDFFSGMSDTLGQYEPWSWWIYYRAFSAEKADACGISDVLGEYASSLWWTFPLLLCALLTASWVLVKWLRGGVQHDMVAALMTKFRRLVARRKRSVLNSELRADETTLTNLRDEITAMKRSWATCGALLALAACTGGWSKVAQIPYDLVMAAKRRRLRTEFQRLRFGAANKYYCAGGDTDPKVHRLPPDLLMKKAEWKTTQTGLVKKIKGVAERLKHEHGNYKKVHKWLELVVGGDLYCPIEAAAEAVGVDVVQSVVEDWAMDVALDIALAVIF